MYTNQNNNDQNNQNYNDQNITNTNELLIKV